MSDISINMSGNVSATLIQKRRVISASSGDASSPALAMRGSKVIPQIGQLPGSERTICGCIGQTYSLFEKGWVGATGSSPMPHIGHDPGWSCRISECIGYVYGRASAGFGGRRVKKLSGSFLNFSRQRTLQKWNDVPLYSNDPALVAGSTSIPHTGSITVPLIRSSPHELVVVVLRFRTWAVIVWRVSLFRMGLFHHLFVLFGRHVRAGFKSCLFLRTQLR